VGDDAGMTDDPRVRLLSTDEHRAANTLFRGSLHHPPATDEAWAQRSGFAADSRVLGAYSGDVLTGTALSNASDIVVPGGATLPMAMVTGVGVRADHARRGVLTALMRAQLTGIPEPVATLRASEAAIYGRFGYGVATRGRTVVLDRRAARPHGGAPAADTIRLLSYTEAEPQLPSLYQRVAGGRPGWIARPATWWQMVGAMLREAKDRFATVAVHSGPDGDDGFAFYVVERENGQRVMALDDLFAGTPEAWAGLWRFLLSVDLVAEIRARLRAVDEPLELLFADRRVVKTTEVEDETWLRLVDVPAALAARTFADAGSVVIEVRDDFLPANSGRYRIGDGPARPVDEPAELTMDVDALAMAYLGDVAPSALAATGRLTAVKTDALRVADQLFATPESPWCGTYF
jgi:predicted acetyltransferase